MENRIGSEILWLEKVDSTNNYASSVACSPKAHGVVVSTKYQTDGKGQRGNTWESGEGENLLFSVILKPNFLEVQKQFLLSKIVALSICDLLSPLVSEVRIKWPNDIYVNDSKIAGVLIENSFSSPRLETSIIGIGININQAIFSDDIPNPTSLLIETGGNSVLNNLLQILCEHLNTRYSDLRNKQWKRINDEYAQLLYRKDSYYTYFAEGKSFKAIIFGVRESGELILKTEDGEVREFSFKEVSFGVY